MAVHNLPTFPTPFIGRADELADLSRLLGDPDCRLVTLVGPGGIGKTRLAAETMQQFLKLHSGDTEIFSNGIYFIPFQPISSPDFMVSTVAEMIGCQFHQERDPRQQLLNHLREKSMLLMLDNLEHLTDGLQLLSDILNTAPNVRILATSRERLNLQEEWALDVGGLDFPTNEALIEIERFSAVQLFLLHAHRIYAGFSLDEVRKRDVIRICRMVEGMPLAIELAAAWVRMLPCETIAAEIEHSLDILESSARNVVPRHQNLRAALEPTWNRLPKIEQAVYKKLSVFRGGFTREAAEAVADTSLRTLSALVDKSLVRVDANGRFDMHELLRQYAEEQLARDATAVQQVRDAHAMFFTELLKRCELDLSSWRQREVVRQLESELDNIRAAWRWAVDQASITAIQAAAQTYYLLSDMQGRYQEVSNALSAAIKGLESLPSIGERDFTLAVVYNAAGGILIRLGRFDNAKAAFQNSFRLYQNQDRLPPPGISTEPLAGLGLLASTIGDYAEAVSYSEQALNRIDTQTDKLNLMFSHYVLAISTYALGQYERAFNNAQRAYQISNEFGDQWFGSYIVVAMGNIALAIEDYDQAWAYYQASYKVKESFNDLGGMAFALNGMARIAWLRGEYHEAAQLYQQGLESYREVNDPGGLATSMFGLGNAAQAVGDYPAGRRYFHQALKIAVDIHWSPLILEIVTGIADLLVKTDEPEHAVELLTISVTHGASEPPTRRRAERLLEHARILLAPDEFDAARRRGETIGMDELAQLVVEQLKQPQDDIQQHAQLAANQKLIEPLTEREQDVLRLMAAGLNNPQIAEQLVVAVGTVKAHTNSIFGKLGVSNRVQAVNRAKDLNIV